MITHIEVLATPYTYIVAGEIIAIEQSPLRAPWRGPAPTGNHHTGVCCSVPPERSTFFCEKGWEEASRAQEAVSGRLQGSEAHKIFIAMPKVGGNDCF